MLNSETQKRLTELSIDAEAGLSELLKLDGLQRELWFMRLSTQGNTHWEVLMNDTKENDEKIKQKIAASEQPVGGLVLAFVGMVEWRGAKKLMAYLQCFRAGYQEGILCLRPMKETTADQKFEPDGAFMIAGSCKNIWI